MTSCRHVVGGATVLNVGWQQQNRTQHCVNDMFLVFLPFLFAATRLTAAELFLNDSRCREKLVQVDHSTSLMVLQMRPNLPQSADDISWFCQNHEDHYNAAEDWISQCLHSAVSKFAVHIGMSRSLHVNRHLCKNESKFLEDVQAASHSWPSLADCINRRRETAIALVEQGAEAADLVCNFATARFCVQEQLERMKEGAGKEFVKEVFKSIGKTTLDFMQKVHPEYKENNCTPEAFYRDPSKEYSTVTDLEPSIELMDKSKFAKEADKVASLYNSVVSVLSNNTRDRLKKLVSKLEKLILAPGAPGAGGNATETVPAGGLLHDEGTTCRELYYDMDICASQQVLHIAHKLPATAEQVAEFCDHNDDFNNAAEDYITQCLQHSAVSKFAVHICMSRSYYLNQKFCANQTKFLEDVQAATDIWAKIQDCFRKRRETGWALVEKDGSAADEICAHQANKICIYHHIDAMPEGAAKELVTKIYKSIAGPVLDFLNKMHPELRDRNCGPEYVFQKPKRHYKDQTDLEAAIVLFDKSAFAKTANKVADTFESIYHSFSNDTQKKVKKIASLVEKVVLSPGKKKGGSGGAGGAVGGGGGTESSGAPRAPGGVQDSLQSAMKSVMGGGTTEGAPGAPGAPGGVQDQVKSAIGMGGGGTTEGAPGAPGGIQDQVKSAIGMGGTTAGAPGAPGSIQDQVKSAIGMGGGGTTEGAPGAPGGVQDSVKSAVDSAKSKVGGGGTTEGAPGAPGRVQDKVKSAIGMGGTTEGAPGAPGGFQDSVKSAVNSAKGMAGGGGTTEGAPGAPGGIQDQVKSAIGMGGSTAGAPGAPGAAGGATEAYPPVSPTLGQACPKKKLKKSTNPDTATSAVYGSDHPAPAVAGGTTVGTTGGTTECVDCTTKHQTTECVDCSTGHKGEVSTECVNCGSSSGSKSTECVDCTSGRTMSARELLAGSCPKQRSNDPKPSGDKPGAPGAGGGGSSGEDNSQLSGAELLSQACPNPKKRS